MRLSALVLFISGLTLAGCSGSGSDNPVALAIPSIARTAVETNHHLWGIWDVYISADRADIEVAPMRLADLHLNAVRLLETAPCSTCLTISNIHKIGPNVLEADVTLKHPFPGLLKCTGFDVRGIFIAQTDYTFPVSGRRVGLGNSVPRMLNPDGFTSLFNPTEYPETNPGPPALRYIPGKKATGGYLSATLNPFVAYRRDAPRRMFESGGFETRTVRLYAPAGPIYFGYAVDVCWQPVENVVDPLVDFPPAANCLEAYKISVTLEEDSNSSVGSSVPISVEVFDHQGLDTIFSVAIEVPALFSGESALSFSTATGADSFLFTGTVTNAFGAIWGDYPLLVRVVDKASDPNLGVIDAWSVVPLHVKKGWARSWGDHEWSRANGVAMDSSGCVYVCGLIYGMPDMDPGLGEDIHVSSGQADAYLSKFDSNGVFQWARTWGGSEHEDAFPITIDNSGGMYIIGYFQGTVDFDPGSGEDIHIAVGDTYNMFLSKFSSDGTYKWARTWFGPKSLWSTSVAVDKWGGIYAAGAFTDSVDFDPGPGEEIQTATFGGSAFLLKMDTDGNFKWVRSWGGGGLTGSVASGVAVDNTGTAIVTGLFSKTVDFDPGLGEEIHSASGYTDAFLSKFNSNGDFLGVLVWGGEGGDKGLSVAVGGTGVYVVGTFAGPADLDPGPGEDIHEADTIWGGVYLSKFNSIGIFQWARSWDGPGNDITQSVSVGSDNVYVTGTFTGSIDFDPGPGEDIHTADDTRHTFLSNFTPDGVFRWARSWDTGSGAVNVGATGVASDSEGNAYMAGYFAAPLDFDPTTGIDIHTPVGHEEAFLTRILPDGNW